MRTATPRRRTTRSTHKPAALLRHPSNGTCAHDVEPELRSTNFGRDQAAEAFQRAGDLVDLGMDDDCVNNCTHAVQCTHARTHAHASCTPPPPAKGGACQFRFPCGPGIHPTPKASMGVQTRRQSLPAAAGRASRGRASRGSRGTAPSSSHAFHVGTGSRPRARPRASSSSTLHSWTPGAWDTGVQSKSWSPTTHARPRAHAQAHAAASRRRDGQPFRKAARVRRRRSWHDGERLVNSTSRRVARASTLHAAWRALPVVARRRRQ